MICGPESSDRGISCCCSHFEMFLLHAGCKFICMFNYYPASLLFTETFAPVQWNKHTYLSFFICCLILQFQLVLRKRNLTFIVLISTSIVHCRTAQTPLHTGVEISNISVTIQVCLHFHETYKKHLNETETGKFPANTTSRISFNFCIITITNTWQ